jgi:ABC-type multidrug transport system fused ATPase/permease subunit
VLAPVNVEFLRVFSKSATLGVMVHVVWGIVAAILISVIWRMVGTNTALRLRLAAAINANAVIQRQLAEAVEMLAQYEGKSNDSSNDGLFQSAVEGLIGLGVPGLVLLIATATTGFAGAAALTTALAALGGPLGMVGGIAVLLLLVLVSKALASYGLPRMAQAVVRGLIAKGESPESIRKKLDSIPKWVIAAELRTKIDQTLNENTTPAV